MQTALKATTIVLPGGRVEVTGTALPIGQSVDVFIVLSETPDATLRPFGLCAGELDVPDDFDAPLPENVLLDFEGA